MVENNRPRGREKNVTGQGKELGRQGAGLGSGPVGTGTSGRPGGSFGGGSGRGRGSYGGGGGPRRAGGQSPLLTLIILAVLVLGGGGAGLSGLLGGLTGQTVQTAAPTAYVQVSQAPAQQNGSQQSLDLSNLFSGYGNVSSGWSGKSNVGNLDTSVSSAARAKRTTLKGGGKDTVTLMVYMCGTDLESKYKMATADLTEMASADLDDLNVIVYTGGCTKWQNSVVSNKVNQIYKVESGGQLRTLVSDAGSGAMTDPATLTSFIQYCDKNYHADRMCLILWDHGGGSLSGFGYDEKNSRSGSMTLAGINEALKAGGITYDFIGFDACLMATLENALMLSHYADYLIASEETEPGVGWYYTDWLTKWNRNTSMSTLEIGRNIVDDFVSVCAKECRGQSTTLSVIDLAELEKTVPAPLKSFSQSTTELLQSNSYQTVSKARSASREFSSNKIDQVDLVDLCYRLGTQQSTALASSLLGAVKYNRCCSSMTNSYGLSIYFPYQKTGKVSSAVSTYGSIGMDDDYARCIQQFAAMGSAGQSVSSASSSYASSPLESLLGLMGGGAASSSSSGMDADAVAQLLLGLLGSGDRSLDPETTAQYLLSHQLDGDSLRWVDGKLTLSEEQWGLVNDLELNVFYDDGEGYLDLGLDNVFEFTADGALKGEYDGTWLAIDGQIVAYYHTGTVEEGEDYTITGYVPVLLNGERARLLLVFDQDNPYGVIVGARSDYLKGETDTVAKALTELAEGDEIQFLCDYYGYDGAYRDSYRLAGDPWRYHADCQISNVYLPDETRAVATYKLTDLYGQSWWTPSF